LISLTQIDLLSFQDQLRIEKDAAGVSVVFDVVRRKKVRVTPEEIVRQLWITYFLQNRGLNPKLIAVERAFEAFGKRRRFDLVVFDNKQSPVLLAEFKAPEVVISQSTFDQIAVYNLQLNIPYALVSNGVRHFCFRTEDEIARYKFLEELPV
jgi:hypothetical protein